MLLESEPGRKPECISASWMALLSLCGFACCFKMWFEGKVGNCMFIHQKVVYVTNNYTTKNKKSKHVKNLIHI